MSRAITITSGKGGVGKTNISLNLALHLSKVGYHICLFDADFGLANINILLGLQPEYDLKDVILNGRNLRDIIITTHERLDILPGSSGLEEMANLEANQIETLIQSLSEIEGYDFLLFDTSAGISKNVISFCLASPEVLIVITPEPTSLTDAYALLKVLTVNGFKGEAKLVLNQFKDSHVAKLVYGKFQAAVMKHLGVNIPALGTIYQDSRVPEAVKQQKPFLLLHPESQASKCIQKIGWRLLSSGANHFEEADMVSFWTRCLKFFSSPLKLPGKKKESDKDSRGPQEEIKQTTEKSQHENLSSRPSNSSLTVGAASKEVPLKMPSCSPQADREKSKAQAVGATGPVTANNLEKSLIPIVEKLIGSVSSVSNELKHIREALQEKGMSILNQENSVPPDPHRSNSKPIHLDLEAFLERQGLVGKEPE